MGPTSRAAIDRMTEESADLVPIDPQEFLSYVEFLESVQGQSISYETYALLMTGIAEAIGSIDFEDEPVTSVLILDRVDRWIEHLLAEVTSVRDPDGLRNEVRLLRESTAKWHQAFQELADRKSDSE